MATFLRHSVAVAALLLAASAHSTPDQKIWVNDADTEASRALAASLPYLGFVSISDYEDFRSCICSCSCTLIRNNPQDGAWIMTNEHCSFYGSIVNEYLPMPYMRVGFQKNWQAAIESVRALETSAGITLSESFTANNILFSDRVMLHNLPGMDLTIHRLEDLARDENGDLIEPIPLYTGPVSPGDVILIAGYGQNVDAYSIFGGGSFDGIARAAFGRYDRFSGIFTYSGVVRRDTTLTLNGVARPGDSGGLSALEIEGVWHSVGPTWGGGDDWTNHSPINYPPNFALWLEKHISENQFNPDFDGDGVPNAEDPSPDDATDGDGDTLSDDWELHYFGTLDLDGTADSDLDTLLDADEFARGTNPKAADSDGDTLSDAAELAAGTDPTLADSDGDKLPDNLDPNPLQSIDTDGNGLPDDWELFHLGELGAHSLDKDADWLNNTSEYVQNTDPNNRDTDGDFIIDGSDPNPLTVWDTDEDGLPDDWEFHYVRNMSVNPADDDDNDGLNNLQESQIGTNPRNADTDDDHVIDSIDPNPLDFLNTDGDALSDDWEMVYLLTLDYDGSDDPDGDWLDNSTEYGLGSDPLSAVDTDDDGMADDWERHYFGSTERDGTGDQDEDGLTDADEYTKVLNPNNPDTDGDNVLDGSDPNPALYLDVDGDSLPDDWEAIYLLTLNYGGSDDPDDDRLNNEEEYNLRSNPLSNEDADGDSMADDWERYYFGGTDRDGTESLDEDGLSDAEEYALRTNPGLTDTDGDWLDDHLDPFPRVAVDTDDDYLWDDWERYHFGNLDQNWDDDFDDDGVQNYDDRTSPNSSADDDLDDMADDWERYHFGGTDRDGTDDLDEDGLSDAEEYAHRTNPGHADTDGDGVDDLEEIVAGSDPRDANSFPGCTESEDGVQSADQDGDFIISLSELLRVIQFYNSLGLHCADVPADTEDGYLPGPGANQACAPYSTDYNPQDWAISLSELLRIIQFYNSLGYNHCPSSATEDGFCPGL